MADGVTDTAPTGDTSSNGAGGVDTTTPSGGDGANATTSSGGSTGSAPTSGGDGANATTSSGGSTGGDAGVTTSSGGSAGTTPAPAPSSKADDAGVPQSIIDFEKMVVSTWNTQLTSTSCLHRHQRNAVRNVLRGFMSKNNTNSNGAAPVPAPTNSQDLAPAELLSYPYMLGNSYYKQLMSYGQIETLAESVRRAASVNTVGQYVLYLAMYYMTVGREQVSMVTNRSSSYASSVLTIMLHKILNRVYEIHASKQCTYMFVGIPAYYWHGVSVAELQTWGASLLRSSSMKLYRAYLTYLANNPRNVSSPRLKLEYMGESWGFRKSVPEFVMEGLCLRADDNITRYDGSTVRAYLDRVKTDAYSYYEFQAVASGTNSTGIQIAGVPVTGMDYTSDVSAFLVTPPASEAAVASADPYGTLGKLITPEECGTQLTDEDADPAPRDASKDVKLADGQAEPSALDDLAEDGVSVPLEDEKPGEGSASARRGDLGTLTASVRMIRELEARVATLVKNHLEVVGCCNTVSEGLSRLEKHADTLRRTMLALVRKINVQTGRGQEYVLSSYE
nr:MAG: MC133L [Molluscum contagiosum virus]